MRDTFVLEGSVRDACERHGVGSGQVYTWRLQALSNELTGRKPLPMPSFAEVSPTGLPMAFPSLVPSSQIGIELPSGIRLMVDVGIDAEAIGRMVAVLSR